MPEATVERSALSRRLGGRGAKVEQLHLLTIAPQLRGA